MRSLMAFEILAQAMSNIATRSLVEALDFTCVAFDDLCYIYPYKRLRP